MKKAKFHYENAAMAGHEAARINIGVLECNSGNKVRAISIGRLQHLLDTTMPCMK
jgi:hypothetical protein